MGGIEVYGQRAQLRNAAHAPNRGALAQQDFQGVHPLGIFPQSGRQDADTPSQDMLDTKVSSWIPPKSSLMADMGELRVGVYQAGLGSLD